MNWNDGVADYYREYGHEEECQPVCISHIAFTPCRHGKEDNPCLLRDEDKVAHSIVGRYYADEISRSEAIARLSSLEDSQ